MNNPVLKKEMRTSMRTWKTSAIITVYALLLASIPMLYILFNSFDTYGGYSADSLRTVFISMVVFQLVLLSFVAPAMTTNSISGEVQRGTIDLLICTKMSSFEIVMGKLMAGMVKIFLLIIVSLPLFSVLSIFGGVETGVLLLLMFYYMIIAIQYGAIGIFTSAFFKKNSVSTIVSYLIIITLNLGTVIFTTIAGEFYQLKVGSSTDVFLKLLYINPFSGLFNVIDNLMGTDMNITGSSFMFTSYDTLIINIIISILISIFLVKVTANKIDPMKSVHNVSNNKAKRIKKKENKKNMENEAEMLNEIVK